MEVGVNDNLPTKWAGDWSRTQASLFSRPI